MDIVAYFLSLQVFCDEVLKGRKRLVTVQMKQALFIAENLVVFDRVVLVKERQAKLVSRPLQTLGSPNQERSGDIAPLPHQKPLRVYSPYAFKKPAEKTLLVCV